MEFSNAERATERGESTAETLAQIERRINRRLFLGTIGGGAAAGLLLAGCGGGSSTTVVTTPTPPVGAGRQQEIDVFNFALNLEYLEAEFYSYALNNRGIDTSLTTGFGIAGGTTGGRQVSFSDELLRGYTADILNDELNHIKVLRQTIQSLGGQPIAKPPLNLNALNLGFGNQLEFVAVTRAFTDTGTSAYAGSARLITEPDLQQASAQILAAEGYHAGNIRLQYLLLSAPNTLPPLDAKDQPPATNNFFATDANALAVARTPAEVALIVRGPNPVGGKFFPSGLNGNIR
ncbi:MAG: ferritin-like domain-containing protein [Armatimonadota bacterium]